MNRKIYTFIRITGKGPISIGKLKKQLYRGICEECEKQLEKGRLQLDHIIPIAAGGHIFDLANLQLVCYRCHKNKTKDDSAVIAIMKRIGLLKTEKYTCYSSVPISVLHAHFRFLMMTYRNAKEIWHAWDMDKNVVLETHDNRSLKEATK